MKIVYFIDHLRPDGTQRVLGQLVEGLAAHGHRQAVVCLNAPADPALAAALRACGAEMRIVGKRRLLTGLGLLETWAWLRHRRFDVAVTLLFAADVVGRSLAQSAGIRTIVSSLRARNTHYAPWQRWIVRQTMRWADTVVLNSAFVRPFAVTVEGAPPARTVVIRNGVDIDAYATPMDRAALRAALGLPRERQLMGAIGRLNRQKGFDVLLEALARLACHEVDLLLIGQGEDEAALRAQADALGIAKRVHFLGYRRDVPRLLGALDLYVHPARFEGMPNALLEAMAAGCPIVATAVDGNRELIEDGVSGWLVGPEDAARLATAIDAALSDASEARGRGQAASSRAANKFSVEAMVTAWERVMLADQNEAN